jgi:uncharacterized coiled-coil DUF342 family protein
MAAQTTTATTAKKAAPKRKPATRKAAARKPAVRKTAKKTDSNITNKAQETARELFLAGLGVYGKVFDEVEDQLKNAEKRMEARRKKADKLYNELVKRGEQLEKEARKSLDDIELPRFQRKDLEQQLEKARDRFAELKDSFGSKKAA